MSKNPAQQKDELVIQELEIKKAKMLFRALNHKLRLQILQYIHKNKQTPVTPIYEAMNLEQSETSQHLGILRRAGFVVTEKDGKFIYYSVNYKRIEEVQRIVGVFLGKL